MANKQIKRFIAGAVCPRCEQMDKLVIYQKQAKDYRECVNCGFKDELRFKQHPRELATRVNMTEAVKQNEVQTLILDLGDNKKES